jgi:transcriptional regulator with XRE-family HTH domain
MIVRTLLKAELKRKGITYAELARRLGEMGIEEREANIRTKLVRGRFTAVFLVQCLMAIGSDRLRLD